MASKVTVEVVDDLDGSVITGEAVTIQFGLDGKSYVLDLSVEHAEQLRGVFAGFVGVARRVRVRKGQRRGR